MSKKLLSRSDIVSALRGPPRQPRNDPSADQTAEEIAAYYQNAKIGDRAAIRQSQYRLLRFTLDEIENIKPKIGRLYLRKGSPDWGGSAFYRKSGKSCFAPTGQTRLVIPTPDVTAWVKTNPIGSFDWA
jgi:hypothetical protein